MPASSPTWSAASSRARAPLRARRRASRGQGNTEYVVIVALVAIAAIGIITLFGDNVRRLFGTSSDALGGDDGLANTGKKSNAGLTNKNMKNFAKQSSSYDPQAMSMMRKQSAPGGGAAASAASFSGGAASSSAASSGPAAKAAAAAGAPAY